MSDLGGLREQDAWGLSRSFGRAERISAQKDKILGLERRGRCAGPLAARFCARPRVRGLILERPRRRATASALRDAASVQAVGMPQAGS